MREIKFRGKRLDSGKWIEGSLITSYRPDKTRRAFIVSAHCGGMAGDAAKHGISPVEVVTGTVGQLTDRKDKHGKEPYEGDIVQDIDTGFCGEVVFDGSWWIKWDCRGGEFIDGRGGSGVEWEHFCDLNGDIEIIGNIHDNLELLKTERQ